MAGNSHPVAIPEATVARLPLYLRSLQDVANESIATISSVRLADTAGVNAAKVRKDLSYFGSYGTRGVGYDVKYLLVQIRNVLGLTHDWPCVIVGLGNLGQALAKYGGFSERGFVIAGLVDADPDKAGTKVNGIVVSPLEELGKLVRKFEISIGVISTPAGAAQDVADRMVEAGISSILNFAPTVLSCPPGVSIRKVDLASELQILSFYQERRTPAKEQATG